MELKNMFMPQKDKFIRKREPAEIGLLSPFIQLFKGFAGCYDMETGKIEVGCVEEDTFIILWHETMHKYLFENISLESAIFFDEIGSILEYFLFGKNVEYTHVMKYKVKAPEYVIPKHRTLEEQGIIINKESFGIALTTYKTGIIKDYRKESENITKIIFTQLFNEPPFDNIKIKEIIPTIGYWKGNKEPSTTLILEGKITSKIKERLLEFKEKYKQDSIMLIDFTKKDWNGIKIKNIEEKDLQKLGFDALSYYFKEKTVMIFQKESFDICNIREKLKKLKATYFTFMLGIEFI